MRKIITKVYNFNELSDEAKEKAIEARKRMTKAYAGGYYGYHYSVKTLDWALKNNDKIKLEDLTEIA